MYSVNLAGGHGTGNSSVSTPMRANMTACIRCRQKKKRCDQKLPKCRLCELAGVECLGYDAIARKQVARSYVQSLEQRVAYLESKLQEQTGRGEDVAMDEASSVIQAQPELIPLEERQTSPSFLENGPAVDLSADDTTNNVLSLIQPVPQSEHSFSKLLLTDLMRAKHTSQTHVASALNDAKADYPSSSIVNTLYNSAVALPEKESAQGLARAYFQHMNLGMPLLHEPTFRHKLDLIYTMPPNINLDETHTSTESRIAIFFVFEVLAVAMLSLQKQDPTAIPTWLADRYHQVAITALNKIGIPNSLEGVQALLLIGQYLYHHPMIWSAWKTVGAALRLAVELGLHQDPASKPDFLTLDTMRRTFWVAYAMDRNTSMNLARPTCLSDGAISAQFPSVIDDKFITADGVVTDDAPKSWSKCISHHLFRYRQIQSEIRVVLYEKAPPYCSINLDEWQPAMRERIEKWHDGLPNHESFDDSEKGVIDTFQVTYNTALFHLYRPSGNIPSPSDAQLVSMSKATVNMIQLYRRFFREKKLTIYWQSVENLSSAGTALMFGYVQSNEVRDLISFRTLESLIHSCSSVLWGMVERFPAFQGKRDAFDMTASKVLADLSTELPPIETKRSTMGDIATSSEGDGCQSGPDQRDPLPSQPIDWPNTTTSSTTTAGHSTALDQAPFSFDDLGSLDFVWEAMAKDDGAFSTMWME